jgi:hypothetical protein
MGNPEVDLRDADFPFLIAGAAYPDRYEKWTLKVANPKKSAACPG